MQTLTQEKSTRNFTAKEPKMIHREADLDMDYLVTGFESLSSDFPNISTSSKSRNRDEFFVVEEPDKRPISTQFSRPSPMQISSSKTNSKPNNKYEEGEAQKKFGGAKAISSDQFFRDSNSDNMVSYY